MTDDLISRQEAIDILEEQICVNGYSNVGMVSATNKSIGRIMRLPTAGCEYWDTESNYCALYRPAAVSTVEPKWIPCSERLPEEGEGVLWCTPGGYVCSGCVMLGRPIDDCGHQGNYIAWMPLPEPFREEESK